jgi:Flp pilus assembly protein TadD
MPTRLALMRDQVRYQPGSADAVFELAYEYFRLRNYNDAAIGFKRVLLTRPNDVEALNNYAVALYRTRRGDLARESLRRAGDLAAGHAVVQRNLGVVLDSQGRVADAVVAYAKAAKAAHEERKPKIESRARDARGYCLERLEKLDDAAREYDLAYELDGDNFQAKENRALGQALLRRRHLDGLCKQLGKAKIEDLPRSDDEKKQDALDARTLDPRALEMRSQLRLDGFDEQLRGTPKPPPPPPPPESLQPVSLELLPEPWRPSGESVWLNGTLPVFILQFFLNITRLGIS